MITCRVKRVIFENLDTGFSICQAEILDGEIPKSIGKLDSFVIKGYFPKSKVVELKVDGDWQLSPQYGYQLNVLKFTEKQPTTKAGIIAYLSAFVYGLQEKTAKKIVAQFGLRTLEVFQDSPEMLLNVRGIGRKKLEKIISSYQSSRSLQEVVTFLMPFGVSANQCAKIVNEFGGETMNIIKNEPFRLCDIEGFGFKTVDEIARRTTFDLKDSLRIKGAIKYVLQYAASEGHVCLPQRELLASSYLLLNLEDFEKSKSKRVVKQFVEFGDISCLSQRIDKEYVSLNMVADEIRRMAIDYSLKGDNGYAYLPLSYEQEVDSADIIARRLKKRSKTFSEANIRKEISVQERNLGIRLATKQVEAVIAGVNNNTCIITGGPGVGKTTVLKMVLSVCQKFENLSPSDVTLLAPTGRAAQRMCESVGKEYTASTIHSCLKICEEGQCSFERIESKIVVVDESSMMDNYICWCLLNAVPYNAKLIIIGDAEQLPSVGAGNVLYEFLKCHQFPVVRLDVIYRQSGTSSIVVNADLIKRGITNLRWADDFKFISVKGTDAYPETDTERSAKIQREAAEKVVEQYMAAVAESSIDEVQVLCPMRKAGIIAGATELNRLIQERVNPHKQKTKEVKRGQTIFRINDKVILTKNNYDMEWYTISGEQGCGLFNGDVGYVKDIDIEEHTVTVDFNGKIACIDFTQLRELELAYAISIHKSQGSEYRTCIIPILTQFAVMLKRNLIYTGITRAKEKVIIVGHQKAIEQAISTNVIAKRYTQLGDRIINNNQGGQDEI